MPFDIVATVAAPQAIGPYSQAVSVPAGRLIFCSGQIPIDPQSGELTGAGDIRQETHRVMKNLDAVLRAAGSSLHGVVKTTIYLVVLGGQRGLRRVFSGPPASPRHRRGRCSPTRSAGRDRCHRAGGLAREVSNDHSGQAGG
jgi:reactive intermediate/imine deaminase